MLTNVCRIELLVNLISVGQILASCWPSVLTIVTIKFDYHTRESSGEKVTIWLFTNGKPSRSRLRASACGGACVVRAHGGVTLLRRECVPEEKAFFNLG